MTQALDVTFCACSTTMGVMGVEELDLIEGVRRRRGSSLSRLRGRRRRPAIRVNRGQRGGRGANE
jgi:hypothetical protein